MSGLLLALPLAAQIHGRARSTDRAGILTLNPANGAEEIAVNQRVVIRLAHPVAPEFVGPQSVRLVSQHGVVSTTTTLSENHDSITVKLNQPLEPFSTYTILISPLGAEAESPDTVIFRSSFRTG